MGPPHFPPPSLARSAASIKCLRWHSVDPSDVPHGKVYKAVAANSNRLNGRSSF